jgi:hypothetical protein
MVIRDDRSKLDEALRDEGLDAPLTILVLCGGEGSAAEDVHAYVDRRRGWEPWRRWFLVTDSSILDATTEQGRWFGASTSPVDRYAVLVGTGKDVGATGAVEDLLLKKDRSPSILKIRAAFASAEAGS